MIISIDKHKTSDKIQHLHSPKLSGLEETFHKLLKKNNLQNSSADTTDSQECSLSLLLHSLTLENPSTLSMFFSIVYEFQRKANQRRRNECCSFEDMKHNNRKDMVTGMEWSMVVRVSTSGFLFGTQQEAETAQARSEARLKPLRPIPKWSSYFR